VPETRYERVPVTTACTVISLRVSVPVLSEPTTVTHPSVSTLGSRRTSALRAAIRCTPSANTSVTTAGSPSGTAATAKLTDRNNTSHTLPDRSSSSPEITATIAKQTATSTRPSSSSRRWSGVVSVGARSSRPAIRPSSVCIPVATTRPAPRPAATTVPAWTTVARSPSGSSAERRSAACFTTGSDSPVSVAS